MGYVTASELTDAGVQHPDASDLIEVASLIIDAHVAYPVNPDGYKFPRVENGARRLAADDGVPAGIKAAVIEQVRWMGDVVGPDYVYKGGDRYLSIANADGGSETKTDAGSPLLAPMARLLLRPYLGQIGYIR